LHSLVYHAVEGAFEAVLVFAGAASVFYGLAKNTAKTPARAK
jgi:hypothetical protein